MKPGFSFARAIPATRGNSQRIEVNVTKIDPQAVNRHAADAEAAAAVVKYRALQGRLPDTGEPEMHAWLERKRRAVRRGRITAELCAVLDAGAPGWRRSREDRWNESLRALAAEPTPVLRTWLHTQRRALATGKLSEKRRKALDAALGSWSTPAAAGPGWDSRADDVIDFVDLNGRFPRTSGLDDEAALARWLTGQRAAARAGKMSPKRMTRLDKAVPGWLPEDEGRDFIWQAKARELSAFVAGRLRWPTPSSPAESGLAAWARTQRTAHRSGRLNADRTKQMAAIPGWPDAVIAKGGVS